MNLLRECTFFDRDRNALIELDDLIEEAYYSSRRRADGGEPPLSSSFYLILYFSADWLPDASNNQLNDKLRAFMDATTQANRQLVELVFVSSDKTSDSYWSFLKKFPFIRYSLAFHEKDLKVRHFCVFLGTESSS